MNIAISVAFLVGTFLLVLALVMCGGDQSVTPAATQEPGIVGETTSPGEPIAGGTATPENTAPRVGASAQVTKAAVLQLSGSALDETLPGGQLTTQWTLVSGPGAVEFADPTKVDTTVTFTIPGTYVLRLTATDGEFTVSDDVTVEVQR